jgi:hypothetical protein
MARGVDWRRSLPLIAAAALLYLLVGRSDRRAEPGAATPPSASAHGEAVDDALAEAIRERASGVQVAGEGVVVRILADDHDGSRHQRFVLRLATGQTLLLSHNIDLAPRVPELAIGDPVGFRGVYEWNERGGVVHWTHHDPDGRHEAGWLEHRGRRYS